MCDNNNRQQQISVSTKIMDKAAKNDNKKLITIVAGDFNCDPSCQKLVVNQQQQQFAFL